MDIDTSTPRGTEKKGGKNQKEKNLIIIKKSELSRQPT